MIGHVLTSAAPQFDAASYPGVAVGRGPSQGMQGFSQGKHRRTGTSARRRLQVRVPLGLVPPSSRRRTPSNPLDVWPPQPPGCCARTALYQGCHPPQDHAGGKPLRCVPFQTFRQMSSLDKRGRHRRRRSIRAPRISIKSLRDSCPSIAERWSNETSDVTLQQ
jgi:hypothetical protein